MQTCQWWELQDWVLKGTLITGGKYCGGSKFVNKPRTTQVKSLIERGRWRQTQVQSKTFKWSETIKASGNFSHSSTLGRASNSHLLYQCGFHNFRIWQMRI